MINELNHFGIVVRDLDASLAFYQGAFGARIVFRNIIAASSTDVVYLQIAGGLIELLHPQEPAADETFGITHIAFMTDDLDADYDRGSAGLPQRPERRPGRAPTARPCNAQRADPTPSCGRLRPLHPAGQRPDWRAGVLR